MTTILATQILMQKFLMRSQAGQIAIPGIADGALLRFWFHIGMFSLDMFSHAGVAAERFATLVAYLLSRYIMSGHMFA